MKKKVKCFYLMVSVGLLVVGGFVMLSPWSRYLEVCVGFVLVVVSGLGVMMAERMDTDENERE
jgi:hypothetical protein